MLSGGSHNLGRAVEPVLDTVVKTKQTQPNQAEQSMFEGAALLPGRWIVYAGESTSVVSEELLGSTTLPRRRRLPGGSGHFSSLISFPNSGWMLSRN